VIDVDRAPRTSLSDGDRIQITSGLLADDIVVVDGAVRLRDGSKVRISAHQGNAAANFNKGPGAPPGRQPGNTANMPPAIRRIMIAHIIGTSVSETTADGTMVIASVMANSWNRVPSMNRSGIRTAMSETPIATLGPSDPQPLFARAEFGHPRICQAKTIVAGPAAPYIP
jgi:hypothetical protein